MLVNLTQAFSETKYLTVFAFGLIIIVLYAKDKFNLPTYDREALGPFAHLPPQSLTLDSRYRRGRAVYLGLIISLYIAICVLGPITFPHLNFEGSPLQIGLQVPSGPQAQDITIWPLAAATFLVSTAAAGDNTMLGRIELYIRQYAHKSAYIPTAVSNLAFSLRHLVIQQWLIANPYLNSEQINFRQRALGNLIGDAHVADIMKNPDDDLDLATWVRANILFYTLSQIFNKQHELSSSRLDYLTDLPENVKIFQELQKTREGLRARVDAVMPGAVNDADKLISDIRHFAKDTAVTIAVLLSQAARNSAELADRLDQLGFQGVQLPERADHFGYVALVYASIACGLILSAFALFGFQHFINQNTAQSGAFSFFDLDKYNFIPGLATLYTGCIVYLVVFRATDYMRDNAIDSMDWIEGLSGYVRLVLVSSIVSSVVAIIFIGLFFAAFLQRSLWTDLSSLFQVFIFQFVIAILGSAFGLAYLRQAAQLPQSRTRFFNNFFGITPILHACVAALFVGGMAYIQTQYGTGVAIKNAQESSNEVRNYLTKNLDFFGNTKLLPNARAEIIEPLTNIYAVINNIRLLPESTLASPGEQTDIRLAASPPPESPGEQKVAPKVKNYVVALLAAEKLKLRKVCAALNQIDLKIEAPNGDQSGQAAAQAQQTADGQSASPQKQKLFSSDWNCEPIHFESKIENKDLPKDLPGFAQNVSSLYQQLKALESYLDDPLYFRTLLFPMLSAFLIAFSFGVGCRHWRAWWLKEGIDEPAGQALQNKIKEVYGQDIDVERCLITPVASLDKMAPIETLRYEDYRAKLFRQVQKHQIKEFANLKRALEVQSKISDVDGPVAPQVTAAV